MRADVVAASSRLHVVESYTVGLPAEMVNVNTYGNRPVGGDIDLTVGKNGAMTGITAWVALSGDLALVNVARSYVTTIGFHRRGNRPVVMTTCVPVGLSRHKTLASIGQFGQNHSLTAAAGTEGKLSLPLGRAGAGSVTSKVVRWLALDDISLRVRVLGNRCFCTAAAFAQAGVVRHGSSFRGYEPQHLTSKAVVTQ